jgi:hypothetical protein
LRKPTLFGKSIFHRGAWLHGYVFGLGRVATRLYKIDKGCEHERIHSAETQIGV